MPSNPRSAQSRSRASSRRRWISTRSSRCRASTRPTSTRCGCPRRTAAVRGHRGGAGVRAQRLPARARPPRADHARHEPARDVQDRREAAARRVRHPGAARQRRRSASTRRPTRPTRAGRWSTPPPSGCRSRCASRTRGAAARGMRVDGRAEIVGSKGAVLGRSRDADVVIDDPNVSRHHAEVRPSGGSWIVNDLGSTNGIKVNGRRVDGPAVAQARRRDRDRHLPGDVRAGVADGARPDRRRPEVRLPRRPVPVPAVGRALRAEGPAGRQRGASTSVRVRTSRTPPACTPRRRRSAATGARRSCG